MRPLALVLACAATASAAPEAQVEWSDTPAWPDTGERLVLVWVISADRPAPPNELARRPVSLVATIGKVSREVVVKPETGALRPRNQVMCKTSSFPLARGELAKVTFDEGGASGYVVRRPAPDVLEIHHWIAQDGACDDGHSNPVGCPIKDELRARLHIPAGAPVAGGSVLETVNGKLRPVACGHD